MIIRIITALLLFISTTVYAANWQSPIIEALEEEALQETAINQAVEALKAEAAEAVVVLPPTELGQLAESTGPENEFYLYVAWDANVEPDLKGYKIHVGQVSRLSSTNEKIEQWCKAKEPNNAKCVEEWLDFCTEPMDKVCHAMLYAYEEVFDVGKYPDQWPNPACGPTYDPFKVECCEFKLIGFKEGTYYMAATAYDEDDNESAYSEELVHYFHKQLNEPTNLKETKE